MTDLVVHGGKVICGITCNNKAEVIEDGAIAIKDGRISGIGTSAEIVAASGGAPKVGGKGFVVFPGLVNAHHHVGLTPLQLGTPDMALEMWVNRRIGSKAPPLYLDTLYSAFEMIRSGVTTVQHLQGRIPGPVSNVYERSHEVLKAYSDIGMRASYSFSLRHQNRVVYDDDERFLARLPDEIASRLRAYLSTQTIPVEELMDLFKRLHADLQGSPTLAAQLAPLNLQWCSDEALAQVRDVADEYGACIHMHLLETRYQEAYARKRTGGQSAVEHVSKMGLLSERMTLGHGVWMSDRDLDIVRETGTHICHNCSSNMRIHSGRAPVAAMRKRGIGVAIGIDEAGLNDDRDMLQEMRLVLHSNKAAGIVRDHAPCATEIMRMATEFGAATTPFRSDIGRLDEGKAADMVLLDWSQVAHPYLDESVDPVDALVHRAKSRGVHTVLINGEIVLQDGRFVRVDEDAVLDEIAQAMERALTDDETAMRAMARDLMPYIADFYDGYAERADAPAARPSE